MKLVPIEKNDFPVWAQFRAEIYPLISRDYDLREMETVFASELWYCWFISGEEGEKIGLVELSLRNIVDGCLSSPVPYLEGLYLVPSKRGMGRGAKVIEMIINWCRNHGYTEFATDAELSNARAQQFYEKLGFEKVDQVVEYKITI